MSQGLDVALAVQEDQVGLEPTEILLLLLGLQAWTTTLGL